MRKIDLVRRTERKKIMHVIVDGNKKELTQQEALKTL